MLICAVYWHTLASLRSGTARRCSAPAALTCGSGTMGRTCGRYPYSGEKPGGRRPRRVRQAGRATLTVSSPCTASSYTWNKQAGEEGRRLMPLLLRRRERLALRPYLAAWGDCLREDRFGLAGAARGASQATERAQESGFPLAREAPGRFFFYSLRIDNMISAGIIALKFKGCERGPHGADEGRAEQVSGGRLSCGAAGGRARLRQACKCDLSISEMHVIEAVENAARAEGRRGVGGQAPWHHAGEPEHGAERAGAEGLPAAPQGSERPPPRPDPPDR